MNFIMLFVDTRVFGLVLDHGNMVGCKFNWGNGVEQRGLGSINSKTRNVSGRKKKEDTYLNTFT